MLQRVAYTCFVCCLCLLAMAPAAEPVRPPAQPDMPAVQPRPRAASPEDSVVSFAPDRPRSASRSASGGPTIWSFVSILAFMAIMCGLLLGGLCIVRKHMPGGRQMFSSPAMELLGRAHLDQKRYVSLLRVGRRVIIIGVTADELTALGEIHEESEVSEILEVARPKTEAGLTMFQKLFARVCRQHQKEEAEARIQLESARLEQDMNELKNTISSITRSRPEARLETVG